MMGTKQKQKQGRRREWTHYDDALQNWMNANFASNGSGERNKAGLADSLEMPRSTVSRMLKGKRRIAAAELPVIERYLGKRAPRFETDRLKRK